MAGVKLLVLLASGQVLLPRSADDQIGGLLCVNPCVKTSPKCAKIGEIDQNVQKPKVCGCSKLGNKRGCQNSRVRIRSPLLYPG